MMTMSNSSLVSHVRYSPNHSGTRQNAISKIAIHHMAGNLSIETCGSWFSQTKAQASSNYGIGSDGRIGLYVDEANRAWTTYSSWCDNQAVTIEVANDQIGGDWHVSDKALNSLVELCTDICKRNGITNCTYTGDKLGVLQKHEWYVSTNCPGPYLGRQFSWIAAQVNTRLGGQPTYGWIKDNVGWWYKNTDGSYPTNTWSYINDEWYYFNAEGYAVVGWQFINGKWYLFNEDCKMQTGWQRYQDKWYYLKPSDGDMVSDEFRLVGDTWYMFTPSGEMVQNKVLNISDDGSITVVENKDTVH